ncbi:hypothetical protein BUE93_20735 [Chromobacterium amazonense]|uniref:Uncharacterized protein n=1 Tax=Chromobacterium amazonense TaxID=1382803 RepID=A0A2S9WZ01_9NEIS|nr:hypothetical protein [Chromobacterium amazonense]PRP68695.1 hypothetical protein BUE93_20735 [Chromobacterium amazonense]
MYDAYSVLIRLSLINNVSHGILGITRNLQAAHIGATDLQKKLDSIGKSAAMSGMMFAGGFAIAGAFKAPIEKAVELQREIAKLKQMGLGDAQIADAQKFVQANNIIGTSYLERMKLFTDAQGAFRESGKSGLEALQAAKVMAPVLAQYNVALSMLSGEKQTAAQEQLSQLNKTVELMGGLLSPTRASQITDGIFKAVQSSGRMISNRDLRQFISQGGSAVSSLTDKTVFAGLEPIIGEFGGYRVGTGMNTAYNRTHGIMSLAPSLLVNEMLKLGLWDKKKVERTKGGGARFHGNPLLPELAKLQETDSIAFAKKMMEIYRKNGITNMSDIFRENSIIFGTTGSRIYNKIMQQMPVLEHSEQAFDKSLGIQETIKANENSPMMQIQKFHKAMDDLGLAIGKNALPVFIPLIQDLTALAKEMGRHPTIIRNFTYSLMGLSGFLIAGGLINGIAAAGKGFGLLYSALGGVPAAAASARLSFIALTTVMGTSVTQIGILKSAFAAFAAYQVGHLIGEWLNDNVLTPLIKFFTGGKSLSLGDWIYNLIHGDEDKNLAQGQFKIVNGHAVRIPPGGGATPQGGLPSFTVFPPAAAAPVPSAATPNVVLNHKTAVAAPVVNVAAPAVAQAQKLAKIDLTAPKINIPAPPPRQQQTIQVNTQLNLDGRKIGEAVTKHQVREASKPLTGMSGFDTMSQVLLPGMSSKLLPTG